jgi:asparagine synthase (glutamine-hydrolysing)
MCGFAVTVQRRGHVSRARLAQALSAIGHRGPDATGLATVVLPARGEAVAGEIGFGHARLAIIDLDPRSHQPFRINGHLLAYNGELYNHRRLAAGMNLSTEGDTEVMLRMLMEGGVDALHRASGMWSFCWLDEDSGRLTAARDRYGKKPLFYAADEEAVHFASEPAALAILMGRPLAMRAAALDSFLADGWLFPDPTGETHLSGIREVPPGYTLTLDLHIWSLTLIPGEPFPWSGSLDAQDMSEDALVADFADAVSSRLMSDRKVGLFLSGGVDSSLILSVLAARGLTDRLLCITGDAGRSDDARYARACVEQLGVTALNIELPYGALGLDQFHAVCRAQAKPFPLIGNVLGMHALYKAVAEHDVRVVLDGSGADEIFGGYWHRYFGFALRDAEAAGDRDWIDAVSPSMPRSFRQLGKDNRFMPQREGLSAQDLTVLRPDTRAVLSALPAGDPMVGFGGTLGETLAIDASAGRMQEWLWQNDRNAMAAGIENRCPFLDHRLARFASTPYHRKFGGEWNKRELRSLFPRFTPLPTAERRDKQGFRWAFAPFFRNNLDEILAMIAGSASARRYVEPGAFCDALKRGDLPLESPLLHRLTVAAGLEAAGLELLEGAGAPT